MNKAVLVIDVQRGLFDAVPKPDEADETIERINHLTARARQVGVPVIFIQHEDAGALAQGSECWRLATGLVVGDDDYRMRKTTPDSFLRTGLHELLVQWGVNALIICGYASEFCVDTTTRRAAALGFDVQLVADGHTTHDKDHASAREIRAHHNATLPNIVSFGTRIVALPSVEIRLA